MLNSNSFYRKFEDEKFQQNIYVKYSPEQFVHIVDPMNTAYDKGITEKYICNVLW